MNQRFASTNDSTNARGRVGAALTFVAVLVLCCGAASAQNTNTPSVAASSVARATHILGFENVPNNSGGQLSIQGDDLQFQGEDPPVRIKISSIRDFSIEETDKQVGGVPMMLGKAAVPYGGGRAISLFSHKKYGTLSVEYLDNKGGVHGAIFQLSKGQTLADALAANGFVERKPKAEQSFRETMR